MTKLVRLLPIEKVELFMFAAFFFHLCAWGCNRMVFKKRHLILNGGYMFLESTTMMILSFNEFI